MGCRMSSLARRFCSNLGRGSLLPERDSGRIFPFPHPLGEKTNRELGPGNAVGGAPPEPEPRRLAPPPCGPPRGREPWAEQASARPFSSCTLGCAQVALPSFPFVGSYPLFSTETFPLTPIAFAAPPSAPYPRCPFHSFLNFLFFSFFSWRFLLFS